MYSSNSMSEIDKVTVYSHEINKIYINYFPDIDVRAAHKSRFTEY